MAFFEASEGPWPALLIGVPLLAAFTAIVTWRAARLLIWSGAAVVPVLSVVLLARVIHAGGLRLPIGGWAPPLGIAFAVDGLSAGFIVVTGLVMAGVLLFALPQFTASAPGAAESRAGYAFVPLVFLAWAALNALFLSGDLFNLYVALELLTLSAVALVAIDGRSGTIAAAIRYALFGLFGSLAYLLGAALLYAVHGTLDMALIAERATADGATVIAGALMTAGLAAKTALFPFHAWLPPAHSGAPAPASAILSGLVPKASFYIIVRIWFDVMPQAAGTIMPVLLGVLGSCAIIYGSVLAIRQEQLKLVIAYSTVAQLGYLFLIFPLAGGGGEPQPWAAGAWTGGIIHAFSHALAKAAMFLCAGLFMEALGHDRIAGLRGAAHHLPLTVFAFALAGVSLMGLPPSGGFTAKYLLLTASFAGGQIGWAIVIMVGGLLAALYLFRPLTYAFTRRGLEEREFARVPRPRQVIPLLLAGLSILLGIASAAPYDILQIGRPHAAVEGLE
ncbi:MAG TPA: proton-conducting transporter membrane subunit [Devosiaceae bacterium]|jgi:formate hydrogenlyase subunit 3/multisubunit Na+/H+ antiporter MnhD subunit|nr:proton-conducting transporter membrane subunit [Devosiaceae bacterium]